ncbi:MAG: ABC transporter substrate-binding protein [Candidatus Dormibacteraceae bacterium]
MSEQQDGLKSLITDYMEQRIDRRLFFGKAIQFGLATSSIAAILAACTSGGSSTSATTPQKGGTLVEGYDRPLSKITTVNAAWIDPTQEALLEGLIIQDPNGNYVPSLASSFRTNADASEWRFKLRTGLKFQSGAPVTLQNVVDDFNLFRSSAGQNAPWWAPVKDIAIQGDEVVVTCKHPYLALHDTLQNEFSNIFNSKAQETAGDSYGTTVVDGTGPFTLVSYTPDQVVVKRWENYPGTGVSWFQNKGTAYLDGVKWIAINEAANRANELLGGTAHVVKNPLPSDIANLKADSNTTVYEQQGLQNVIFGLNFQQTALDFDKEPVRQAISMAIDRKSIVSSILLGHGAATFGPFPTSYKWYEKGVEQYNQFDAAKAGSLLDSAGWTMGSGGVRQKNGKQMSFTFINMTDATRNLVGDAVVSMLQKVGVQAKVSNLEAGAFFSALVAKPDAYFFNWLWASPPNLLDVLVDPAFIPAPNWAHANVPEVTAALQAWLNASSPAQLEQAARQIQLTIAQHVPVLPLYTPNDVWAVSKKVHGYVPTTTNLYPFYNDVWLEH